MDILKFEDFGMVLSVKDRQQTVLEGFHKCVEWKINSILFGHR